MFLLFEFILFFSLNGFELDYDMMRMYLNLSITLF
jgi:hypothetical protein